VCTIPGAEFYLKAVEWRGDSREVIRRWPAAVRANFGADLRRIQEGKMPLDWKPFPGLVKNAFELRAQDKSGCYRAIYVTIIKDKVVVLHCFKKNTRRTERVDISTANYRLRELLDDVRISGGKGSEKE
jgi:phage-related protein